MHWQNPPRNQSSGFGWLKNSWAGKQVKAQAEVNVFPKNNMLPKYRISYFFDGGFGSFMCPIEVIGSAQY